MLLARSLAYFFTTVLLAGWLGAQSSTPIQCSDSDGGLNYNQKGALTIGGYPSSADYCVEGFTFNLFEFYCGTGASGGYGTQHDKHVCPVACRDGACIRGTCTDTDKGPNELQLAGRALLYPEGSYELVKSLSDSCADADTLNEARCAEDGQDILIQTVECPSGCSNGVCLAAPSPTATPSPTPTPSLTAVATPTPTPKPVPTPTLDACQMNADCSDGRPCTRDVCSGTPRACSNSAFGCEFGPDCVPAGEQEKVEGRLQFCSESFTWTPALEAGQTCSQDYECVHGRCSEGRCTAPGGLLEGIGVFFGGILQFFKNLFGMG